MSKRWMCTAVGAAALAALAPAPAGATGGGHERGTTAWKDGALRVDTAGVTSRSDLVLEEPAWREQQSMPLGNGRLGAAVWARDGFTAQLNRNDTFPDLRSAGRLVLPGLLDLAAARDYRGRLDLHDGQLVQRGGGMTARAYVRADADQLVVEVTGAPARERQTAELTLWEGRRPATSAQGGVAALAETFTDARSGITTGAVAAATADARDVAATVVDGDTVRLDFAPNRDGSFRIVVGVPSYAGGDVAAAARAAVAGGEDRRVERRHLDWWHDFWDQRAAPLRIDSRDGVGEYMEALRAQHLYVTASTMRNAVPTGQAGAANMLYPWKDGAVSPSTWFHFNIRQGVFANLGAGIATFNEPYLRLYTDRLERLRAWTREHWPAAEGTCIPELIRFDGTADGCVDGLEPAWTNKILTGGLEASHTLWLTARHTNDAALLRRGWPLMREVARFYLSLLREGADGRLHLEHVQSFETQWDTTDPTTDVAGMRVMFPVFARLAAEHGDGGLAARLRDAIARLPELPTTTRNGEDVLAWSATDEPAKNTQNTDLEPIYPWGLLGADSKLAQATFRQRVFPLTREWDDAPIWAARVGLADEMKALMVQGTEDLQKYPNGFTVHGLNDDPAAQRNMYWSWSAIVAGALQDALARADGGVVRIASAWPREWDADGTVELPGGHRVSVQMRDGAPLLVGLRAGADETLTVASPWPGERVRVVEDGRGRGRDRTVVGPTPAGTVQLRLRAGRSYVVERVARPVAALRFRLVTGAPEQRAKRLGERTLGIADGGAPQVVSDLVRNVAPEKLHTLVRARVGDPLYVDNGTAIASLPRSLDGALMIRGAAADAKATAPAEYLSFDLARPAPVSVAFDARGEGRGWPAWLAEQGWERTGETVGTRDHLRRFVIRDGERLRVSGGGVTLTRAGADWGDQTIETTVTQIQVGASVMFRARDARNGYVWQIGGPLGSPGGLGQLRMSTVVDGRSTLIGSVVPIAPAARNTYRLRIEAIGDRIRTYLNGALVDDRRDATHAAGRVGFSMGGADVGEYDELRVTAPDGRVLFADDFSGDLAAWDVPAGRQDTPLVVFRKPFPAGRVVLGPNSGTGQGDASYVTFVGEG